MCALNTRKSNSKVNAVQPFKIRDFFFPMLEMHQKAYIAQSMYWWSKRSRVQTNTRVECSLSPLTGFSGLVA